MFEIEQRRFRVLAHSLLAAIMLCFCFTPAFCRDDSEKGFGTNDLIDSLDFKEAAIADVLDEISKRAGYSIIVDEDCRQRRITLSLRGVSPKVALDEVLSKAGLRSQVVSDDLIVVTAGQAAKPQSEELTAAIESLQPKTLRKGPFLVGRIEHSEKLSPLEASLRAGAELDIAKLKALTPNNFWYKVPAWWCGNWHKETTTSFYFRRLKKSRWETYLASLGRREGSNASWAQNTFLSRSDSTHGFQRDRKGDIWEYAYNAYLTLTEHEDCYTVGLVRHREALQVEDSKVVMRYLGTVLAISKDSRVIGAAQQIECISTYTPAGGNLLRGEYSTKEFDEDGQPESETKGLTIYIRTSPFQPCNELHGANLFVLFREFLESRGLNGLIPL